MSKRFVADGLLPVTATALLTVERYSCTLGVILYNAGPIENDVQITLTRPGSTARLIGRTEIKAGEFFYLGGIGLDPDDVLSGQAEFAAMVEYSLAQENSRDNQSMSARPLSHKFAVAGNQKTGAAKLSTARNN